MKAFKPWHLRVQDRSDARSMHAQVELDLISHYAVYIIKLVAVTRYSCHQKSAYTMLHCCNWQHNPASPNAPAFQLNILLGIAQPSLSITRFRLHSKICVSVKCLRPAAGAVQQSSKSKSRGKGRDKLWQFVLHRQCNVLWKPLQVVALKAKVC